MKLFKKTSLYLITLILAVTSIGTVIFADDDTEYPETNLVSIIDNPEMSEEDKELYYDAYKEYTKEINDNFDIYEFSDEDEVLLEDEVDTIIEEESEIMTFSSRAVVTKPLVGYFKDYSLGSNADVFPTAYSSSAKTYINKAQEYTGMFPILEDENGRYRIIVAGVDGWVEKSGIVTEVYDNTKAINVYVTVNGSFNHIVYENSNSSSKNKSGYYSVNQVGYKPDYIKENTNYYSFDGHYFYTNFNTMFTDYINKVRTNSINATNPYYNYFQFLPYRSTTNYTGTDLDGYFSNARPEYTRSELTTKEQDSYWDYVYDDSQRVWLGKPTNVSKLYKNGNAVTTSAKNLGANGLTTYSLAILESGWGASNISLGRNNLFGHSAYDSNPSNANKYETVQQGVDVHHGRFLSYNYLEVATGLYEGGAIGDKDQGLNVHYSSDPYWGEKAASIMYTIDAKLGKKDYNKYTLGITTDEVNLRTKSTTTSSAVYQVPAGYPVIIHNSENGQAVNSGNSTWYRVSADNALTSDGLVKKYSGIPELFIYKIDADKNTGYLYSDYVKKVNETGGSVTPPTYAKGDVNGDGKVSTLDYVAIKNHILGVKKLTGDALKRADVNEDGKVSTLDYVAIKNHILGIKKLD